MATEIKRFTDNGFTSQQAVVLVEALAESQEEVRSELVTKDYLDTRITGVRMELADVRTEVGDVRKEISDVQKDIGELRAAHASTQKDVSILTEMVVEMKAEMSGFRAQLTSFRAQLTSFGAELISFRKDQNNIISKFSAEIVKLDKELVKQNRRITFWLIGVVGLVSSVGFGAVVAVL